MSALSKAPSITKSAIVAIVIILVALFVVFSPQLLNINTEQRSKASVGDQKPITGTFFMQDFNTPSPAIQRSMVKEMAETGIDTIILLAAGTLEKNGTGYKETISMTMPNSMYRTLLPLAREFNMKVYVGLASFDYQAIPYWVGSPTDTNTNQGRIIDYSLRLIDATRKAAQEQQVPWDTIAGFYISTEAGPAHFNDPNSNEILFYKRLSQAIKQKEPNKKILLSPWLLEDATYDQVKAQYTNLLQGTAIDILAPQDSMGSLKVTSYGRNADHFRALHDAVAQFPGREAWANIETQLQPSVTDGNYNPSTITRVQAQIASAKPHVTKMITWIYQHTMLSEPWFDTTYSWTGQYTPQKAAARKLLRKGYIETYVRPTRVTTTTTTPSFTPTPSPVVTRSNTCTPRYYCNTTAYSCDQTSSTYNVQNQQCGNTSASCQANLAAYLSGKTTGTCFTTLKDCQSTCIRPPTIQASPPVIEHVFFYYNNLVIKGKNFGKTGSSPLVTINYGFKQHSARHAIVQEEKQVIYIAKTSVPDFDPTPGKYTITITP
jgi:hypothetical protein